EERSGGTDTHVPIGAPGGIEGELEAPAGRIRRLRNAETQIATAEPGIFVEAVAIGVDVDVDVVVDVLHDHAPYGRVDIGLSQLGETVEPDSVPAAALGDAHLDF